MHLKDLLANRIQGRRNKYKLFDFRCNDKRANFVTIPTLLFLFAKKHLSVYFKI